MKKILARITRNRFWLSTLVVLLIAVAANREDLIGDDLMFVAYVATGYLVVATVYVLVKRREALNG